MAAEYPARRAPGKIGAMPKPALRPGAVVYQIFPDRFRRDPDGPRFRSGDWRWHREPIVVSSHARDLTHRHRHQATFYGGTLGGVARSLEDLAGLGAEALYLTPIFEARSSHRYDTDDYLRIASALGGRAAYDALMAESDRLGLPVVLDGVFNHTSYHHPWFTAHAATHYQQAAPGVPETWMGTGLLPKLDVGRPEVEAGLLGVIDHYPEAAGWRLDASHLLPKAFLARLRERIGSARGVIGEDWDDPRYDLRDGLYDGVTNFAFHRNTLALLNGDCPPETYARRLQGLQESWPESALHRSWNLLNNHDTDRFMSKIGEREPLLPLARLLQTTLPGSPLIYYGDEYGLTGWGDWGARGPWPLNPTPVQRERRAQLARLLAWRKAQPALYTGGLRFLEADNRERTLGYRREAVADGPAVTVRLNFGAFPREVAGERLPPFGASARPEVGEAFVWEPAIALG